MTVNQQVGQAIIEARTRLGVSQYRLAKNLGWSSQRLSHYEKGRTTLSVPQLMQIASALGTHADVLLEPLCRVPSEMELVLTGGVIRGSTTLPARRRYNRERRPAGWNGADERSGRKPDSCLRTRADDPQDAVVGINQGRYELAG